MIKSSGFIQARYPLKKEWNLWDADMLSNKEYWQGRGRARRNNNATSIIVQHGKFYFACGGESGCF